MPVIHDDEFATVVWGDWRETLAVAKERGGVDALIVDAPYSERTHAGHDSGTGQANRAARAWARRDGSIEPANLRRAISYGAWHPSLVATFVVDWHAVTRGWFVSITDHVLAREWECAMDACGRYAFSPLACVEPGSRVRLGGDGPSQWTAWLVASRPRSREWQKWGTLPGAYIVGSTAPDSRRERAIGGKPLALMLDIVGDYSRHGDLVCDPCAGFGTTARAARILGRRFIGGDCDEKAARETARVVSAAREQIALPFAADGG